MRHLVIMIGLTTVVGSGCSRERSPMPTRDFGHVRGTVTLDGQPLGKALISFVPERLSDDEDWKLDIASAATDEHGHYELRLALDKPGVELGPHFVVISKPILAVSPTSSRPADADPERPNDPEVHGDSESSRMLPANIRGFHVPEDIVPAKYNRETRLHVTVDTTEPLVVDFHLQTTNE